jgi:hypothetical protein
MRPSLFRPSSRLSAIGVSAFGLAPCFRIPYATSAAELEEACRRIAVAVDRLP